MSRIDPDTFWQVNEFSRCTNVACSTVPKNNKYHYVFRIPAEHMRPTATSFKHFRTNPTSKKFERCFHFFLDFMQEMVSAQEKKTPQMPGKNTLSFLEWCPSHVSAHHVETAAWRVHVFVDRDMNELRVLESFLFKLRGEVRKLVAKGKTVQPHCRINTMVRYGMDIFGTYTGYCDNIEALTQGLLESPVSPSEAFCLKDIPSAIHGLVDYTNESDEFVFPSNTFLRLDSSSINAKDFSKRILPCHMMFSIVKPEVRVKYEDTSYAVEFLPHRYFHQPEGFTGRWSTEEFQSFKQENADKFLIFEEGVTRCVGEIGEVTYSTKHHQGMCWMDSDQLDEMDGHASQLYAEMRTNQADISTIDEILLRSIGKPDRLAFIDEQFKTKVWHDEDCFISDPLKSIIRWLHKEYDPSLIQTYPLVHDGMSVLGHRACITMNMYDKLYQVSSAHRPVYIIHLMRLDAFRHEMNMHLNCAFTGDAATSKSFVYELLKRNSIEGTVSERTYDTDKADAVDLDMNHMVHVFDEAPPSFFRDPKKRGPLEALKQRLTAMKTSHRRPFTDEETGVRTQITSISQNVGCLMGATNEPRSNFDGPLQTRFNWFEAEKLLNTKNTVAECQHAAETMGTAQRQKLNVAIMFHKFEQAYVALVWQFIYMRRVAAPDTTAVGIVMRVFKNELDAKHGVSIHSRTEERIKRLAQNLTIVRAKQILYHTTTGKFANTPFDISQIPAVEELLVCTEEIVVHAIGLMFDGIMGKNKRRVIAKLWDMHKDNTKYRTNDGGTEDGNFIEIQGHLNAISRKVANALLEDNVFVSACNIVTIFRELQTKTLRCKKYALVPMSPDNAFDDNFPQPEPNGRLTGFTPVETEGNKTYFHVHLFRDVRKDTQEKNIYRMTVQALMHEFTLPRKVLLGMNPFNRNTPHVWDTYTFKPSNGKQIIIKEGIGATEDIYGAIGETIDIDDPLETDVDTHSCNRFSAEINKQVVPYTPNPGDWSIQRYAYPFKSNKRKRT